MPAETSERAGYELKDASATGLAWFVVFTVILLVLTAFVAMGVLGALKTTQNSPPAVAPGFQELRPLPPAPRLQPDPLQDFTQFRQAQQNQLNSSGWIDEQKGIAHIPIDQAMKMLLDKGLPVRRQQPFPNSSAVSTGNEGFPPESASDKVGSQ